MVADIPRVTPSPRRVRLESLSRRRWGALGALCAPIMIVIAGCGGAGPDVSRSTAAPSPNVTSELAASWRDRVVISGSTTVEPIVRAVATTFADVDPEIEVVVASTGTGDGLAQLCSGRVALVGASRPIRDSELDACRQSGIEPVELAIARDGISIVTSRQDPAASCISLVDLYALIGEDSIGLATWAEVHERARQLADRLDVSTAIATDIRNGLAVFAGPIPGSGTYSTLVDLVVAPVSDELGEPRHSLRLDYLSSPDDGLLAATIADAPAAMGAIGLARFEAERDRLAPVAIDAGEGCVEPGPHVVADGRYPLSRTLYLYVDARSVGPVADFLDHLLDRLDAVVGFEPGQVPYVQLADSDAAAVRARWGERSKEAAAR